MRGLLLPSRYRGLTVALLVCALAIRMMIPSGFMLMPAAHGVTLVICPDQGAMPMTMAHGMHAMAMAGHSMGKSHGHQQDKSVDHPCAFAQASAAVDLVSVTHPTPPASIASVAAPFFRPFVRPGLGLAAPPPPKTGPPILA